MNDQESEVSTATGGAERRQFRRLAAGARVRYNELTLGRREREYLKGIAADVSLGGMFIATRHTFPEGTPIALEFHARGESGSAPVRARAVVCWRRRWRRPRGMGVQFIEFEFLGQRRLEAWLETMLERESISA
jgi:c-di-GMP-binding flagellar brake protein YcgR